jgi:hypothetical protein
MSGVPPSAPPIAAAVIGPTGKMSPITLPGQHPSGHSPILQVLHQQQQAGALGRSPLGRSPLQPLQPAAYRSLFSSGGGGSDGTSPVLGTSPANPSRLRQSSGMMPPPPRPPASTAAFLAATAVPGAGHHLGAAAAAHESLPLQRLERASSAGRSSGSARSSPRASARGSPARHSPALSGPMGARRAAAPHTHAAMLLP